MDEDGDVSDLGECWEILHPHVSITAAGGAARQFFLIGSGSRDWDQIEVGLMAEDGFEVRGGSYARVSANQLGDVAFPVATTSWGRITALMLFQKGTNECIGTIEFAGSLERPAPVVLPGMTPLVVKTRNQ